MPTRGRSPVRRPRARSASPDPGKHQANADSPTTSVLPDPSPSSRAQSASPRASEFSLKRRGYDASKLSKEHMSRARPYFNTIHPVKFLDGFFLERSRDEPNLDLSHIAVPCFGNNLIAGELRRRLARALCNAINTSSLCPELHFEPSGLIDSELHIQAFNVENGLLSPSVAVPIYIRDDKYFDPVWDQSLREDDKYDSIRNDLLSEYIYHYETVPRTHMFSLDITGPHARLVRCDHAGVVASFALNWKEDSFYLTDFVHRLGLLSYDGLGFDTTWSTVTPDWESAEVALAAVKADDPDGDYTDAFVKLLLLFDDPATPDDEGSEHIVLAVLNRSSVPKPHLIGRYTMGYRAYDPATEEVIWVKDSWTRREEYFEPEGITMRKLQAEGVPHLARVHSAGYVRAADDRVQITLSGRRAFKWESAYEVNYTHYRIAFRDIVRPLTTYRSTRELVTVMHDAIQAHTSAYAADILHHDVSMGNILIAKDGRGLLIDWEMALDKNSLGPDRYDRARQRRCGTYSFLSTARMRSQCPGPHQQRWKHDASDDLESFFWVFFASIFKQRYVLRLPDSEGGWSPRDQLMLLAAVFQSEWGAGKLLLLHGTADPVTVDKFLHYGMEDVISGRAAPEALVQLLGSLWRGFARQHGPSDVPPESWPKDPENNFAPATILDLFEQALDSDDLFEDDFSLQGNIVRTFELRLPVDMGQRLTALSARAGKPIATTLPEPSMASSASESATVAPDTRRAKRGRDEDEKENEEIAGDGLDVKRRRKD